MNLIAKIVSFQMKLDDKRSEFRSLKVRKGDEFVNRVNKSF